MHHLKVEILIDTFADTWEEKEAETLADTSRNVQAKTLVDTLADTLK